MPRMLRTTLLVFTCLCTLGLAHPNRVSAQGAETTPILTQSLNNVRPACCKCETNGQNTSFCARVTETDSCESLSDGNDYRTLSDEEKTRASTLRCHSLRQEQCAVRTSGSAQAGECSLEPYATLQEGVRSIAPRPQTTPERPFESITPRLGVAIPGLSFSPAVKSGSLVDVPFLAQYISALYRYGVGIGLVIAIIMVIYGGFRYLLGAIPNDVATGKTIVVDAVIGLLVLLAGYAIITVINPNALLLTSIKLGYINPSYYGEGEGADVPVGPTNMTRCRCSSIPTGVNPQSVLKVPCYRQGNPPWGGMPYGTNLIKNEPMPRCPRLDSSPDLDACRGNKQTASCTGTFGQGGCGVTSLAVVLAYYGAKVDNNLVTPIETGKYAVRNCLRPHNGGTIAICSSGFSQAFPGFHCENFGGAARAAREIRAGHPVIFHCSHCTVTKENGTQGSGSSGSGHYMVLTGVSEGTNADSLIFSVHDVGRSDRTAAIAITGQELNQSSRVTLLTLVSPNAGSQYSVPAQRAERCSGTTSGTSGTTQSLTYRLFTYCPGGPSRCAPASDRFRWHANQAWLMIPNHLMQERSPTIRLYVYIHGWNTPLDPSFRGSEGSIHPADSHVRIMSEALSRVNPAKNIIIAGPHWFGGHINPASVTASNPQHPPFMQGFSALEFYNSAVAELRRAIPGVVIRDVSWSGHSAATCGNIIQQALSDDIPNRYGYVLYDGCAGSAVNSRNFSPVGHPLIIDAALSGMGRGFLPRIISNWHFSRYIPRPGGGPGCPEGVSGMECYRSTRDGQWWLFTPHVGHGPDVGVITPIAFRALYGP